MSYYAYPGIDKIELSFEEKFKRQIEEYFKVSICRSNYRSAEYCFRQTQARIYFCFFMYVYLGYDYDSIANKLNFDRKTVMRYVARLKNGRTDKEQHNVNFFIEKFINLFWTCWG